MERFQTSPLLHPFPLHTPWLLSSRSSPALPLSWSSALSPSFAAVDESNGKTKKGKTQDLIQGNKCCFETQLACFWEHSPANACWREKPSLCLWLHQCRLWGVPVSEQKVAWWLFWGNDVRPCCKALSAALPYLLFPSWKKPSLEVQMLISWSGAVHTLTSNCSVVSESQKHRRSPLCHPNSSWIGCTPTPCTSGCPFSLIRNCSAWSTPGTILNMWEILGKEHSGESSKQGKQPMCESSLSGGIWEKSAFGHPFVWTQKSFFHLVKPKLVEGPNSLTEAWIIVCLVHCFLLIPVKPLSRVSLLFFSLNSLLILFSLKREEHTKIWRDSLAKFIIPIFFSSKEYCMWHVTYCEMLAFPSMCKLSVCSVLHYKLSTGQ